MFKKASVLGVVFLIFPISAFAVTANALPQDVQSLQALIVQLQTQVKALQEQVATLTVQVASSTKEIEAVKAELHFTKTLVRGMAGDEVKKLQEFLKQFPDVYPEGLVTGYYGQLTETAVKKLQEKEGIEAVGAVGPRTLSKLNELVTTGAGTSGVIPPGLLTAPGIQTKITTTTTNFTFPTSTASTSTTVVATSTVATTTYYSATTTSQSPIQSSGGEGWSPPPPPPPSPSTSSSTTTATTTTTMTTTSTADVTSPSAPTNLSASVVSSGQINLSWSLSTDNVGVAGYKIYRGGTLIGTTVPTSAYWDTGLSSATTYTYTVAAYDAAGNISPQSTSVSATTLSSSGTPPPPPPPSTVDTQPPSTPTGLTATTVSISEIDLSWDASTDDVRVAGYRIYKNGSYISGSEVTGTSYHSTNLSTATSYSYTVAAYDASGNISTQSNSASATTQGGSDTTATSTSLSTPSTLASILSSLSSSLSEISIELQKLLR